MNVRRSAATAARNPREAGFTLIEALIGISVMGIALLGLAQVFLLSTANNLRSAQITQATFLAQQTVDHLRALTAAELAAFPSLARGESEDAAVDINGDGVTDFRRLVSVQATGSAFAVRVLVFPAGRESIPAETLLGTPADHRVRAVLYSLINR